MKMRVKVNWHNNKEEEENIQKFKRKVKDKKDKKKIYDYNFKKKTNRKANN